MKLRCEEIESPLGTVVIVTRGGAACALGFADERGRMRESLEARFGAIELERGTAPRDYARRVRAYFAGERDVLEGITVDPGGTPFQRAVWAELRRVPWGTTTTYSSLAGRIGRPRAVRAVGRANALNPVALLIPCHRVVGADGSLTGYAGGLARKRWLLEHERASGGSPARHRPMASVVAPPGPCASSGELRK